LKKKRRRGKSMGSDLGIWRKRRKKGREKKDEKG